MQPGGIHRLSVPHIKNPNLLKLMERGVRRVFFHNVKSAAGARANRCINHGTSVAEGTNTQEAATFFSLTQTH